ncbi:helix-turn-helix domain-containing protein [Candidatus Acidulodesulfobacterium sp. H_13]|uniref:helix-turn-helix domain-containing protein n=1 Tax=Candidatus Acidulodesulfobacterium sp. H_13 TaxID=3395470 RepID=UPI003AF67A4E
MKTETTVKTAGEYLKSKREALGFTREKISGVTKIGLQHIEAIENNDLSLFSSPQLLKGYVKSIAKTLGIDDKEVLDLLEPEMKESFDGRYVEDIVGSRFKEGRRRTEIFKKRVLAITLAGISVIALSYLIFRVYEFTVAGHITFPFQSVSRTVKYSSERKLHNGTKAVHYAIVLKGKVIKKTWVAFKIDGGKPKTSMLYPGSTEVWRAQKRLKIKIGNAGGIIMSYNGKNLGKPGIEKQVVTLNFPYRHKP